MQHGLGFISYGYQAVNFATADRATLCARMEHSAAPEYMGMWTEERVAFDLWLERGLALQHEAVLHEPVPDDLLRLLADAPAEPVDVLH